MVDVDGLFIEECKRCSLDPNKCNEGTLYQQTRDIVKLASKHDINVDTQGMTCFEIICFIEKEIEKVKQ